MNIISILAILVITLMATAVFETILRVVLRKRYRFTARRFGIGLLVSCGVVLLLINAGGIINPTRVVASRNTLAFIKSHYPHTPFTLRRIKQVQLSDNEGFFLYKCKLRTTNMILKTTYGTSEHITSFHTKEVRSEEKRDVQPNIGQVSSEGAPSASSHEPSM